MSKSAVKSQDFQRLYGEYALAVRKFLFRMGGQDELDDLVQETFIKVFAGYQSFSGKSSLKTWIFSIALNVARDHLRQKKRRQWLSLLSGNEEYHAATGNFAKDYADRVEIAKLLSSLAPKLREVIVLYCQEELELQEIASILDIPLGTVKSRLHQARSKLELLTSEEATRVTA